MTGYSCLLFTTAAVPTGSVSSPWTWATHAAVRSHMHTHSQKCDFNLNILVKEVVVQEWLPHWKKLNAIRLAANHASGLASFSQVLPIFF